MGLRAIVTLWATAALLSGQTPPLSFEVASVRPASAPRAADDYTEGYNAGMRAALAAQGLRIRGQYLRVTDHSLRDLIRLAYEVKDHQISAPSWMAEEKYEIAATIPNGSGRAQVPEMLRTLLVQRFHLALHRETRDQRVYALAPLPGGPHLTQTAYPNSRFPQTVAVPGRVRGIAAPSQSLADALAKATGETVVDLTGASGLFDFDISFAEAASSDAPGLQAALKKLGLRLEKRVIAVDLLVVDRADKVPVEE